MREYRVLDLFAGAGGFSLGFRRYNDGERNPFHIVGYVEIDQNAANTLISALMRNGMSAEDAGKIVICGDITIPETRRRLYAACPYADIIIGGPPCQSFSTIGPRAGCAELQAKFLEDDRDSLFGHYLQIVEHYMPMFFVFENVTGLLSKKDRDSGKKFIDMIVEEFEKLGYNLELEQEQFPGKKYLVLNAADYGVPQARERVIIIGNRIGVKNPVPVRTHCPPEKCQETGLLPYVTLHDAIGDLPALLPKITITPPEKGMSIKKVSAQRRAELELINGRRFNGLDPVPYHWDRFWSSYHQGGDSRRQYFDFIKPRVENFMLTGHVARGQQETDIVLFRNMKEGTSSKNLLKSDDSRDKHLLSLIKYDMKSFQDKYKKLSWSTPCGTIFAHMQKDGNRFIHPDSEQERTLTVREAARIQSFPDDYVFEAAGNVRYKYVGNAVPPLFSRAIAGALYRALCLVTRRRGRGYVLTTVPSETRSRNMAAIRSRDTKPEIRLRKALFAAGLRFRLKVKIAGSPDIVFLRKKIAVFVDGCFWHGCPKCYKKPVTNQEFWAQKVEENRRRDREVDARLEEDGWSVIRIWEHKIKKDLNSVVETIKTAVQEDGSTQRPEPNKATSSSGGDVQP